jgi:hypothetical protein
MARKRNAWPMNWHNPYIVRHEQANPLYYSAAEWEATHVAPKRRRPTVTRVKVIRAPSARVVAPTTAEILAGLGTLFADMTGKRLPPRQ